MGRCLQISLAAFWCCFQCYVNEPQVIWQFVCVGALHRSQQSFSHVKMISCLPGLNQYEAEDKMSFSRTQHSASGES